MQTASPPLPARDRLLRAAADVFSRVGLKASTTREIAHVAGVNEVTPFRLFKNKRNLLAAVIEHEFSMPEQAPAEQPKCDPSNCLTIIVEEYIEAYSARLSLNLPLVRVLIGEIQHFAEHELKVMKGLFQPDRQKLVDRLVIAQERGLARTDIDPAIVADQLSALIFMGALRAAMPEVHHYTCETYKRASIDTIVRGIRATPSDAPTSNT